MCLNAVRGPLLNNLVDWQLIPRPPPLVSFKAILDASHGRDSFQQPLEEQDHLLVLVHVDFSVVVQYIEADCDHYVDVGWLKHKEIFVLVLEHKLIDERIFLQAFEGFGKFFHVEVAGSILKDFEVRVSYSLVVAENKVSKSK